MNYTLEEIEDFIVNNEDEIIDNYGEDYTTSDVIEYMENDNYFEQEIFKYYNNTEKDSVNECDALIQAMLNSIPDDELF